MTYSPTYTVRALEWYRKPAVVWQVLGLLAGAGAWALRVRFAEVLAVFAAVGLVLALLSRRPARC